MKINRLQACSTTGFLEPHAVACEGVAEQLQCIILFREPGVLASGLIEEQYSMKGFRIDTKSCNWGPMSGFVCVDPRLTKSSKYITRNAEWTQEALSGHIVEKYFGDVTDPDWVADVMPIVISKKRITYLSNQNLISPKADGADFIGMSKAADGDTVLYWRLVPVGNAVLPWLKCDGPNESPYYVLCINNREAQPFHQRYPNGITRVLFRGHETILGLTNPGTKHRGFKACVTADYDLFAIWPQESKSDLVAARHKVNAALAKNNAKLAGGVARMPEIDDRLKSQKLNEHHRFGDVAARVMLIKTWLNTAIMGATSFTGGNAIHHNDEAGNMALAKGSLQECLPVIGFVPKKGTLLIENLQDFVVLVTFAQTNGFQVVVKPSWLPELGLTA